MYGSLKLPIAASALAVCLAACGTTPSFPFTEGPVLVGDTSGVDAPVFDVAFDGSEEPDAADVGPTDAELDTENDAEFDTIAPPIDVGGPDVPPTDASGPDAITPDTSPDVSPPDVGTPEVGLPDVGTPDVVLPGTEICNNNTDDDDDGYVDCNDNDCADADRCFIAEICDNGSDDDGDGWRDCSDPDCERREICRSRPTETLCNDRVDNDGDGTIDCADRDCLGASLCGTERCDDGFDNDGDGAIDCDDSTCFRHVLCTGPPRETNCTDGIDNDSDGSTDCGDGDCTRNPACTSPEVCDNNIDDDGDNTLDCGDSDCAGDPACDEGNCSARDVTTLAGEDYQSLLVSCALPCLGGDSRACVRECVVDQTGISAGCGDCFGGLGECGIGSCLGACASDPGGAACIDCFVDSCGDDFSYCSGFDLDL